MRSVADHADAGGALSLAPWRVCMLALSAGAAGSHRLHSVRPTCMQMLNLHGRVNPGRLCMCDPFLRRDVRSPSSIACTGTYIATSTYGHR